MTSLLLKEIPEEIHKHLLKTQADVKIEKRISQYSLENTVYKLLRLTMPPEVKKTKQSS